MNRESEIANSGSCRIGDRFTIHDSRITMNEIMEPIDKLKQMTAWDADPALTEDELGELLAGAALEDASGFAPLNEEWTATYDLNTAASQAWLIKAARAAATVDEPTAGVVTARVFENCRAMARIYAGKRIASVPMR